MPCNQRNNLKIKPCYSFSPLRRSEGKVLERICSKLGGGLDKAIVPVDSSVVAIEGPYATRAGELQDMVLRNMDCANLSAEYSLIDSHFSIIDDLKTANNQETDLYFYHSDHLGSSSFITDADGIVSQHLQYLPYGELFAEQRDNTARYYTPYKFSAKEKDEETGYSYFGARYYMPELSIWSAVDPLADEISGLSPYAYCANNPVILIDPDGNTPQLFGVLQYNGQAKYGVSRADRSFQLRGYTITPVYDAKNNTLIAYNAGREGANGEYRTEFQMEPVDIANFTKNIENYKAAANLVYSSGEPNWATIAFGAAIVQGDFAGAIAALGDAWANASKDPGFWLSMAASIASMNASMSASTAAAEPCVETLLRAGNVVDNGGLTAAGRAMQKHGSRVGSVFPRATGNAAAINTQGESVLKGIITNPNATRTIRHHARFGNVLEFRIPGGQGARFSSDGNTFIGFIEP